MYNAQKKTVKILVLRNSRSFEKFETNQLNTSVFKSTGALLEEKTQILLYTLKLKRKLGYCICCEVHLE